MNSLEVFFIWRVTISTRIERRLAKKHLKRRLRLQVVVAVEEIVKKEKEVIENMLLSIDNNTSIIIKL